MKLSILQSNIEKEIEEFWHKFECLKRITKKNDYRCFSVFLYRDKQCAVCRSFRALQDALVQIKETR